MPSTLRRAALVTLVAAQGSCLVGAFFVPAALDALTHVSSPGRLRGAPLRMMSGETVPITRRETLARGALGAAGLVLGKKFFDGGSWTGTPDLTGRTIVVTGGNTGLGKETCERLARLGATVIIGSRSATRGVAAASDVAQATSSDKVSSMVLDLADLKSVEAFAAAFAKEHDKLDVLVNNAGVMAIPTREETADGFEKQVGINHFGHFYLTNLLMPQIKAAGRATGDARIINLSSQAHQIAFNGMNFDDLQSQKEYDPWKAYGQSKLANVLFSRELSRRLAESKDGATVSTASCHPGVVRTELGRNFFIPPSMCDAAGSVECKGQLPTVAMYAGAVALPFMIYSTKDVHQGAMTQVRLAADPELKGKLGGNFFMDCAEAGTSGPGRDMVAAARLWKISEELTGRPFVV